MLKNIANQLPQIEPPSTRKSKETKSTKVNYTIDPMHELI